MKILILTAFAVLGLGLGAGIAQPVNRDSTPQAGQTTQTEHRDPVPRTPHHPGPYDNTANSLGGRYVGGGD